MQERGDKYESSILVEVRQEGSTAQEKDYIFNRSICIFGNKRTQYMGVNLAGSHMW